MAIAKAVNYIRGQGMFRSGAGNIKQHDRVESEQPIPLALSWSLVASVSWG